MASFLGLQSFVVYFATAIAMVGAYLFFYTMATAHKEFALIRQDVVSASVALGFSLVGFSLPLSSAITRAQAVMDVAVWGAIAIVVQILAYLLVRLLVPRLSDRIAAGEMSAALFLGAASLAAGILNAASMAL